MKKDKGLYDRKIDEYMQNTSYLNEIDYISKKIMENKVILFLGAGFSCNFGLPTGKQLMKKVIVKGKQINIEKNYEEGLKKLNEINEQMDENNFSLSYILDIILDNISGLDVSDFDYIKNRKKFLMDTYKENLSFKDYIFSKNLFDEQKMSLNIRILIDKIFNRIVTLNYDDIFAYSNGRTIKTKGKYLDEVIINPNQKYEKGVYPIHGTIVNNKSKNNLPIIDTHLSFIENWKNKNFIEDFQKFLENSINNNYIFLFIGCSFSDNFLLTEIVSFIHKNGYFNKEEFLFLVLGDDINSEGNAIHKSKFSPLSKFGGSIKFINLSQFSNNPKIKIDSKTNCVTNFFTYIKKKLDMYEENYMLLNDVKNIKFSEILKEKFDIEKYFQKLNLEGKTKGQDLLNSLNEKEIIFILSLYSQKKFLLQQLKKDSFNNLYYGYIKILWKFVIENRMNNFEIAEFISNSGVFIDIMEGIQSESNYELLKKLGDIYNVV